MKVFVDDFKSNNPNLKPEDIVWDFKGATKENGVAVVSFQTKDKYHYIHTDMTMFGPNGNGEGISIQPIILTKDGELFDVDQDKYRQHPDWYYLCIRVEETGIDGCVSICTPLKHEYTVTYIDYETAFGYNRLVNLEIMEKMK